MTKTPIARSVNRVLVAAGALALGAVSTPAPAAADFQSIVEGYLTLTSATADDASIAGAGDLALVFSGTQVFDEITSGNATFFSGADAKSSVFGAFGASSFEFNVSASATGSAFGEIGSPADAFLTSLGSLKIEIMNAGFTGYTISGLASFTIDVSAGADSSFDEGAFAYGNLALQSQGSGDLLAGTSPFTMADAGYGGPLSASDSVFAFDVPVMFFVGAGSSDVLFFDAYAEGLADSSPVPVPAALPLMASALLGFSALRRKQG